MDVLFCTERLPEWNPSKRLRRHPSEDDSPVIVPTPKDPQAYLLYRVEKLKAATLSCPGIPEATNLRIALSSTEDAIMQHSFSQIDLLTLICTFLLHKETQKELLSRFEGITKNEAQWVIDFIKALDHDPTQSTFANLQSYLQSAKEDRWMFLSRYLQNAFLLPPEALTCLRTGIQFRLFLLPNVLPAFGSISGIEDHCISEKYDDQAPILTSILPYIPKYRQRQAVRKVYKLWTARWGPKMAEILVRRSQCEKYCFGLLREFSIIDLITIERFMTERMAFLSSETREQVLKISREKKGPIHKAEFATMLFHYARSPDEITLLLEHLFDEPIKSKKLVTLAHALPISPIPSPIKHPEHLPFLTAIGCKRVYEAVKKALLRIGKNPDKLIRDLSGEVVSVWLRDNRTPGMNGEIAVIPAVWRSNPLNYYVEDSRRTGYGFGLSAESVVDSVLLSVRLRQPYELVYTMVEGGNCIKLNLVQEDSSYKRIAVIGVSSLYLSHNSLSDYGLIPDLADISVDSVDDRAIKIARNLTEKKVIITPLTPEERTLYEAPAKRYINEEAHTLRQIALDLKVDKVVPIEHPDFHIDIRNFELGGFMFTHSTEKTIALLETLLDEKPELRLYYDRALLKRSTLSPLEARNKLALERAGIRVIEIPGVLESPEALPGKECQPPSVSFMNLMKLSDGTIVTYDCPPEITFLKEAFINEIYKYFPDQTMLFSTDPISFKELPTLGGAYRCKSTEVPGQVIE